MFHMTLHSRQMFPSGNILREPDKSLPSCSRAGTSRAVRYAFAFLCLTALAGCSGTPVPTSQIAPPSARLMVPPKPLPKHKAGDDLVFKHLSLMRQYDSETERLESLQAYVRTLRGTR